MLRAARSFLTGFVVLSFALWLANSSLLIAVPEDQKPKIIAHRGVHQVYSGAERTAATCRAADIQTVRHGFIENTIPSMQAAFAAGADVVELDVHLTTDKVFAVFHDWTLECQTNGAGVTHEHAWADLKSLDIGHGFYNPQDGFYLRGQGHTMPTLAEVFNADLPGQLLINFKSNRAHEGVELVARIDDPQVFSRVFGVYGGGPPTQAVLDRTGNLRGFDRASLKLCGLHYVLVGWTGYVPHACRNRIIAIPMDYGPYLWGWPHRFTRRMKDAGTDVILWGPYDGTGFSSGIDTKDVLARVPAQFDGYIWTNRIETIGPVLKGN